MNVFYCGLSSIITLVLFREYVVQVNTVVTQWPLNKCSEVKGSLYYVRMIAHNVKFPYAENSF